MWRVGLLALVISPVALPADAQLQCYNRSELVTHLELKYNEELTGAGVTSDGRLLEVFASKDGSWTALVTRPDGYSCIIAHGEVWDWLPVASSGQIS